MAITKDLLCHGKDCYDFKIRYPRSQMVKYKNKYYCKDCYDKLNPESKTRQNIHKMIQQIFNLEDVPVFMERQIDKYIRDYNFTEQGIFNTLCYIYLEYSKELDYKYGIYPVIQEYDFHHNYTFSSGNKLKETPVKTVHTRLESPTFSAVRKIKEVRLNDE